MTVDDSVVLIKRFDQDIRACHAMLREMDVVERWRCDEEHGRITLLPVI